MISVLILHYNRVFLLEDHIAALKEQLPSGSQIVVADDGSHPDVVSYIKTLGIDLFCSNSITRKDQGRTIKGGLRLCENENLFWVEEDFYPINAQQHFLEADEILKEDSSVRLLQFGRHPESDHRIKTESYKKERWLTLKRGGIPYALNHPYLIRRADFVALGLTECGWIPRIEIQMCNGSRKVFGESNWSLVPTRLCYEHRGSEYPSIVRHQKNLQLSLEHIGVTNNG